MIDTRRRVESKWICRAGFDGIDDGSDGVVMPRWPRWYG